MKSTRTGHRWAAMMVAAILVTLAAAIASPAQNAVTFTTLHSFNYTDGDYPAAGLVQAINGNLYGTTYGCGGGFGCGGDFGTVFKITPNGTLTLLDSFNATDGESPDGALIQAANGSFYGTTRGGGANYNDSGTVFTLTPGGTLTTLYSFTFCTRECAAGFDPGAGLRQGTNGNFYGTTVGGGAYTGGTIFEITSTGTLKTLYSFCAQSGCPDGYDPSGALVQATDGNFYGTTPIGGPSGNGTVFKMTSQGKLTTLHGFDSAADGSEPQGGLVEGSDGNLYGTTTAGGNLATCEIGCGTVFKISPEGTLTTLYSFCSSAGCPDGAYPIAGLIQASDGNFYGSTQEGGSHSMGTVFKMTPSGMLTTLHVFDGTDGAYPLASLVQDTNGGFYGTTQSGGANNVCYGGGCGTVFTLSAGLSPFVKTLPASGKVGTVVGILGTNLKGATSVTFNGTAATFTVQSATAIKATVPAGATTGPVQVVTPSGTLTSNVNFQVIP